jgi:hypothetical protein
MKKILIISFIVGTLNTNATPPKLTAPISKNLVTLDENAIIINDNEELELNIVADNQDILIAGNNNMINIEGVCKKILITGKGNDVNIKSVDEIHIKGNNNFVSWESTSNSTQKPLIKDLGGYNNIGKRSADIQQKQ